MKGENSLLKRKRKNKSISKQTVKTVSEINNSTDFLDQTYKFLDDIKRKITEIKHIRAQQIEGILVKSPKTLEKIDSKNKMNSSNNQDNQSDSDCLIIGEDKFDKQNLNYSCETFKLGNFDSSNDCLICFKKIKKTYDTICDHKICFKCGIKWVKIKNSCPVCRRKF